MKRILMVDDDEIHLEMAKNILKEKFEIITAKSGKEAIAILFGGLTPHLILLDILMPNMDGWETFNRLKGISLLKNVPIVFLTSVNEAKDKKHAKEIGISDYITKPYKREDIIERIDIILGKAEKKK